jgi:hypothetical protein
MYFRSNHIFTEWIKTEFYIAKHTHDGRLSFMSSLRHFVCCHRNLVVCFVCFQKTRKFHISCTSKVSDMYRCHLAWVTKPSSQFIMCHHVMKKRVMWVYETFSWKAKKSDLMKGISIWNMLGICKEV